MKPFRIAAFGAVLAVLSCTAWPQAFPGRPIKIVVPFAVGGTGDTLTRTIGDEMSRDLGQPIVVDNKPGAGGLVGTELVATAPADGYTLLLVSPAHVILPELHKGKKVYDPIKGFEPITVFANTHQVIVAHPSVPIGTTQELIDYAKKNPGKLNYGSAGTGSATHLNMSLFLTMAGLDIVHVPYKGSTQARNDVLAGQVQLAMDGLLPLQPLIKDGRLKAIALTSSKRSQAAPEIPTIGEVVKGYATDTWYALMAPAGTPRDVVARLNAAAVKALAHPDVKARLEKLGAEPVGNTPEDLRALLVKEQAIWAKVVRDSGAKAD
jgi:tripartite-type tricarboxylate transporter receptor subunit TctC